MDKEKLMLDDLADLVRDRREVYGSPKENMGRFADMLNIYFRGRGGAFTPEEVAMIMIIGKICRLMTSPDHLDTVQDIAGYSDVYYECVKDRAG